MQVKTKTVSRLISLAAQKAGVDADLNWPSCEVLERKIIEETGKSTVTQKYLYDYVRVQLTKGLENNEPTIGLSRTHLDVISNYVNSNQRFHDFDLACLSEKKSDLPVVEPGEILAWYSQVKFGLFNIWRNPDQGILKKQKGLLTFQSTRGEIKIEEITRFNLTEMKGDGGQYWIKVSYLYEGQAKVAYFANASQPDKDLKLGDPSPILKLLGTVE